MSNYTSFISIIVFFGLAIENLQAQTANPNATELTKTVFNNLMKIQNHDKIIFGQYYATWQGVASDNDILDMTGKQPGVTEWHIPFMKFSYDEKMAQIQNDFDNGVFTSFFWRMNNPITDQPESDLSDGEGNIINIETLLPGGVNHHLYLKQLDKYVLINQDLPKVNGNPIPVSFRFMPEMSRGNSRWYKLCTPEQYKTLWVVAFNYLNDRGCNNLLWHFNPNDTDSATNDEFGYLEYYPGHDYVDICGRNVNTDDYQMGENSLNSIKHAIEIAAEADKLVAISQMNSYKNNGDWDGNGINEEENGEPTSLQNYWTEVWYNRIHTQEQLLNKIAFSCAWKNESANNFFLPFKGNEHANDFVTMCNTPEILLASDINLYDEDLFYMNYSDDAIYFTTEENYVNGDIASQTPTIGSWETNSADGVSHFNIIQTTNAGALQIIAANETYRKARYSKVIASNETSFSVSAKISFSRTLGLDADKTKSIIGLDFTDLNSFSGGRISCSLQRHKNNETYRLSFGENTGSVNTYEKTRYVAESLLGFGDNDADSDALRITMTVSKGNDATAWSADIVLRNITTGTEIVRKAGISFDTNDAFFNDNLYPLINTSDSENDKKVYNLELDIFDVSPLSDSSLSIHDTRLTNLNKVLVFPNPVNDVLHVNGSAAIARIKIYSINGQLKLNVTIPNESIDVSHLAKGFYIAKIIDENMTNIKTIKFVKN